MNIDPNRGTGRTTRAIKAAPKNAYYVVPTPGHVAEIKRIAHSVERLDIFPVSLESAQNSILGCNRPFIIDHYVYEWAQVDQADMRRLADFERDLQIYGDRAA